MMKKKKHKEPVHTDYTNTVTHIDGGHPTTRVVVIDGITYQTCGPCAQETHLFCNRLTSCECPEVPFHPGSPSAAERSGHGAVKGMSIEHPDKLPEPDPMVDTLSPDEPVPNIVEQISDRMPMEVILRYGPPGVAVGPFVLLDEDERDFLVQRIHELEAK